MSIDKIAVGIVIGLIFISFVVLFCVLLIKLYIKKIKEHNQKELAFQKTLTEAITETQEQVLNNISQDLHDDAGQQLTYINFQIENLKLDSAELNEQLTPLSQSVVGLSKTIRSISHSLNNQLLLQQDVIKAITSEVERLQNNSKIAVQILVEKNVKKTFTANEKIVIYRIFQEVLNNCLKHAKASVLTIKIETNPTFKMTISDNGQGFDINNSKSKATLGLNNLNQRAEIINYSVVIQSQVNEGTTVILSENNG
jgi:signal transduction histidine kinase